MQSTGPFDPVYGTPGPPFSPPLANGSTLDASSSAALFSTGNGPGGAGEGMQRSASSVSTSSKGKQVDRSGSGEQQERARGGQDEANKDNHAIERVLKRAQANKLARTFRARLAQAGLKQQHGALGGTPVNPAMQYQHPGQPHLALGHPPPPPLPQAFSPHQQQQQHFAPPPPLPPQQQHYVTVPAPSPYASQLSPYQLQQQQQQQEQQNLYAAAQPLPHTGQQQHHHYAGGMDAMLDGGAQYLLDPHPHPHSHSQKRTRAAYDQQHQLLSPHPPLPPPPELPNSYNNASVYAPTPQPLPSASPYSTAGVYQSPSASVFAGSGLAGALGSPVDGAAARPNKRRHPSASAAPEGGSRIGMASPRARTKAGARRSPGKSIAAGNGAAPGGGPLSSSDPNFSSFVDAAAALTGMARAPSDPSQNGSDEDSSQKQVNGASANGAISAPPRPSTPERPGAGGSKAAPGAPGSGGEAGAAEAADLMLYLAQSPSPVQPRRTAPVPGLGGDGERAGMKGRRLFSGMGEPGGGGEGAFGGELGEAFGAVGGGLGEAFGEPTKPAGGAASALSALASELDTPLDLSSALDGAAPATPGRTRQASFGGKGGGEPWETFINASPSPKRSSRRASGMGKAAKVAAATASEAGEAW